MDSFQLDKVSHAPITPTLLIWALKRASLTLEQASHNFVPLEKFKSWVDGTAYPTLAQAERLADKLHIPLPVLFLSEQPEENIPLVDFRTLSGKRRKKPSTEFMDTVNSAIVRQGWYREHLQHEYHVRPLPFVGRFNLQHQGDLIAQDIRSTLRIDAALREQCASWKEFLGKLVQRAEQVGILVMRNGIVGHDNSRKLSIEEFRGFAITDPYAPLIFVNYRDAKAAQIFTLAHELAHIWLGATGVSNPDPTKTRADVKVVTEQKCNAIAAEVLVPKEQFTWDKDRSTEANIQNISSEYRVSKIVVLRRANELGKITNEEFTRLAKIEYRRSKRAEEKESKIEEEGREHFWNWNLFLMRNGRTFTDEVSKAAKAGQIPFIRAAHLLGVKASTVASYLDKFHSA